MEFTVQVLTTGHWPYYKNFDNIKLPLLMQKCTQVMTVFCLLYRFVSFRMIHTRNGVKRNHMDRLLHRVTVHFTHFCMFFSLHLHM